MTAVVVFETDAGVAVAGVRGGSAYVARLRRGGLLVSVSLVVRVRDGVVRISYVEGLYRPDKTIATVRKLLANVELRSFRACETKDITSARVDSVIDELVVYRKNMARVRDNVVGVLHGFRQYAEVLLVLIGERVAEYYSVRRILGYNTILRICQLYISHVYRQEYGRRIPLLGLESLDALSQNLKNK